MKLEVSVPSVGLLRASEAERKAEKARTVSSEEVCHGHPLKLRECDFPYGDLKVFKVEVLCNGRRHSIEKRYSEFYALHKRIKKRCQVPEFPPKHVPNWMTKVLEQRRQGLEAYLQGILLYNRKLPKEFLDFLKLWHFQQDPRGNYLDHSSLLSHRPVISFHNDPYALPPSYTDPLPNTILAGVLQGLYAPETLFCLESKLLMGPGLRLQRVLPSSDISAPPFLI